MTNGLILGIETSCDDTAVALVDAGGQVVSSAVASQAAIHNRYGGVYPEVASRAHVDKIIPTVRMVLEDSGVDPRELTAIGVTRGPGLIVSLMVGLDTASGLGHGWGVPVIGVNHLRGHLRSADLEEKRVRFPAIILLVSGGHTLLARMSSPGRASVAGEGLTRSARYTGPAGDIEPIGDTRDDSVGESYDKVARMLGLGYPGGPVVDRLAKEGTPNIPFPRPMRDQGLEFSFSGLKTAVANHLAAYPDTPPADVAASFVAACMEVLVAKCRRALTEYPSVSLVVVGGVAASPQLREETRKLCDDMGVELCLPPLKWSTDNGAMIALATWDYLSSGQEISTRPQPGLKIEAY